MSFPGYPAGEFPNPDHPAAGMRRLCHSSKLEAGWGFPSRSSPYDHVPQVLALRRRARCLATNCAKQENIVGRVICEAISKPGNLNFISKKNSIRTTQQNKRIDMRRAPPTPLPGARASRSSQRASVCGGGCCHRCPGAPPRPTPRPATVTHVCEKTLSAVLLRECT